MNGKEIAGFHSVYIVELHAYGDVILYFFMLEN